jgi:hypothetical protein
VALTNPIANALCHPGTSPSKKVMIHFQVDKLGTQRSGNATCAKQVLTFTRPHPSVPVCFRTTLSADTRCVVTARWTEIFHHQAAVADSVAVRAVRLHLASRVQIRTGTSGSPSQVQNHENLIIQGQIVPRSAVDPNLKRSAPNTTSDG